MKTTITHQDIVDRRGQIQDEQAAEVAKVRQRFKKERESMEELCGSIGHIFGDLDRLGGKIPRCCVVCGAYES